MADNLDINRMGPFLTARLTGLRSYNGYPEGSLSFNARPVRHEGRPVPGHEYEVDMICGESGEHPDDPTTEINTAGVYINVDELRQLAKACVSIVELIESEQQKDSRRPYEHVEPYVYKGRKDS